jgi:hypothetical protein
LLNCNRSIAGSLIALISRNGGATVLSVWFIVGKNTKNA